MKSFTFLVLFLVLLTAGLRADVPAAPAPRILTLAAGAPHPKALVQRLDLAAGVAIYQWLDASGQPVDSGGSIARFTPVTTTTAATGTTPAVTVPADPGDTALATAIATPPAVVTPVPASLTPRQLNQWLIVNNKLDAVNAAIAAITDATQRALAANWFNKSEVFLRADPLLAQIATAIGMTPTDVDAAFIAAAQL